MDDGDGSPGTHGEVDRETFVETMEGCLTEDTKRADAPTLSPADLKADWVSDLPDRERHL